MLAMTGGPEMVDCDDTAPLAAAADYIVLGEGEIAFAALAAQVLSGVPPKGKIITAPPPDLGSSCPTPMLLIPTKTSGSGYCM
jgi:radical SAM superfamily enzyme YgiQ (UPF0313 family)